MLNMGNDLIKGMQEAIKYAQGKKVSAIKHKIVIKNVDVKEIRQKLQLSQAQFAEKYGFSARTLQHWEQGDRKPQGAARILLNVLAENPEVVERVIKSAMR